VHELYLLRWETDLQLEMGQSILKLMRDLTSAAVQKVLAVTVLTALASAVMWPALLVSLSVDDKILPTITECRGFL
jgi:hypothetical protein